MKNKWQRKILEDVCEFVGGSQPPKSTFSFEEKKEYVRLIQIRDYKSENYKVYVKKNSTKKFCTADDVMIGRYGPPVFQILKGLTGAYNVALMKAVPDESQITKDFLYHFLQTPNIQDYIISLSERAAGQSGVNKGALNEYPIYIPLIPEQKRIVKILDEAFASIGKAKENAEKNLKNSRELFDSYLRSFFYSPSKNWKKKKLEEVCIGTNNINWKLNKAKDFKYIDLSSVSRDTFSILETKLVNHKNAPSRAKKIVFHNDIIFGTTRPTLKRVTKIDKNYDGHICSTGFCVLRPDTKLILPEMIFYFLQTRTFMRKMETIQKGASYPAVTDNEVRNESLFVPSINEQKYIIKSFDSLSCETKKLEAIYNQKLADLEELKKSILQKAFSGEL